MEKQIKKQKYVFIGKTLFFPKEKVLAIGDLHLGYEESLKARGLEMPINQAKESLEEIENLLKNIKAKFGKIEYIVLLGDIKHSFGFIRTEKESLAKLLSLFKKYVENENRIIFIRGNHERNDKNGKYLDYFIVKDIAFVHGDRDFLEIYDKTVNIIVMGHLHPTITLRDKMKIKIEKYKCFLVGRCRKKDFVVVPSFLNITEGVSANEFFEDLENIHDFSIIPQKELVKFEVYAALPLEDEGGGALRFGVLGDI